MKCYIHKETEAVAVCVHCGRAVCTACATPSQSGRLVCSPPCATAIKQMEDFIGSTRHKTTRSARFNMYFCIGLGVVFLVFAIASYFDIHSWPLTGFVGAAGIGFILRGAGYSRVVRRDTGRGGA